MNILISKVVAKDIDLVCLFEKSILDGQIDLNKVKTSKMVFLCS